MPRTPSPARLTAIIRLPARSHAQRPSISAPFAPRSPSRMTNSSPLTSKRAFRLWISRPGGRSRRAPRPHAAPRPPSSEAGPCSRPPPRRCRTQPRLAHRKPNPRQPPTRRPTSPHNVHPSFRLRPRGGLGHRTRIMEADIRRKPVMAERALAFGRAHPATDGSHQGVVADLAEVVARIDAVSRRASSWESTGSVQRRPVGGPSAGRSGSASPTSAESRRTRGSATPTFRALRPDPPRRAEPALRSSSAKAPRRRGCARGTSSPAPPPGNSPGRGCSRSGCSTVSTRCGSAGRRSSLWRGRVCGGWRG